MTTLLISDTHLSHRVFRKKFNYLKSIIEPADRVIIAGDFWDGFLTNIDKFTNSNWKKLFPLLLERQTIYVYGNHDRLEWSNDKVNLFSVQQALTLDITINNQAYHLAHGHTIFTSYEDKYPVLNHRIPLRLGSSIDVAHKLVWGKRFLSKESDINDPMRQWTAKQENQQSFLLCGHSHYPEIDHQHRILNPGFIGMGFGNHIIFTPSGPKLIKERY